MNFEPIDNTLDSNQSMHISSVLESLLKLSSNKGLDFKVLEPIEVRGLKTWEGGIEFDINGEFNSLNFRVSFDADYHERPIRYHVCGGGAFSDSLFLNLEGYYGTELKKALEIFNKYLDCINNKSVPRELLKAQDVWEDIKIGVPRGFEKAIPIFTAVEMKRLWHDFHLLEARRMFEGDFSYSIDLSYDGPELTESLSIKDGAIIRVDNSYSERKMSIMRRERGIVIPDPRIDMQGFFDALNGKGLSTISSKTYHQIKTLEDKLRELPELWQSDLQAVYSGSGNFK